MKWSLSQSKSPLHGPIQKRLRTYAVWCFACKALAQSTPKPALRQNCLACNLNDNFKTTAMPDQCKIDSGQMLFGNLFATRVQPQHLRKGAETESLRMQPKWRWRFQIYQRAWPIQNRCTTDAVWCYICTPLARFEESFSSSAPSQPQLQNHI